jgi:hypothetical protein
MKSVHAGRLALYTSDRCPGSCSDGQLQEASPLLPCAVIGIGPCRTLLLVVQMSWHGPAKPQQQEAQR